MTNKATFMRLAALGAVLAGSGCATVRTGSDTVPTCSSCTLTWTPNGTTVAGTVVNVPTGYTAAEVVLDGVETPPRIPMGASNTSFNQILSSSPARPSSAVMYIYKPYGSTEIRRAVAGTFVIQ